MAFSVLTALELDHKSTSNRFTLIEECNTSDGSFIVSTILEEAVKRKHKIIILLLHNSIGHYYSIAQKLGYNLSSYQEQGNVIIFDFFQFILKPVSENGSFSTDESVLKNLFLDIREKIIHLSQSNDVTLLIDNLGNLLLLKFKLNHVIFFIHYCLSLLSEIKNLSVTCLIHSFDADEHLMLLNTMRHKSYLNINVDDLKTGKAADVSGKLTVKWRTEDLTQWEEPSEYHYHLLDKNVNVFAPGTKYL